MATTELTLTAAAAACCAPLAREPLSAEGAELLARALKAMADPARLRLVSIVASSATGEVCVCDFTEPVGLSQPTVSHHLKILVDAGILAREKRGTWAYFSLVPGALDSLAGMLTRV
ncbi:MULTISPECIES: metalloregulator ArsR/SmtB family transcription factor [Microbacteriaceae]|uniref:Metalloregulator ArsR/SmtB family transcription factor n=1 Tax=Rathayibacter festucae TaxID=110937 RepID=A0ABX6H5H9_9MICO|nr:MULTISPECIES: metalloregulator ArsR/SmtB family transcription factor [Microbacteriaceae]MCJ1709367.1 metalloregulator ArsR/SmtB family transcription factor [Microbacterium sp. VKM Ac-2923]QHC65024.1 metalloregulator ArsR/SmtB family transcription factor [Rathayibacter festucae]